VCLCAWEGKDVWALERLGLVGGEIIGVEMGQVEGAGGMEEIFQRARWTKGANKRDGTGRCSKS